MKRLVLVLVAQGIALTACGGTTTHSATTTVPQVALATGQKVQAIRYDLEHAHHADPSLLGAFAVFAITSRTGVKTAAGDIISRPPLSSVPLDVLHGSLWLRPLFQLDPTQLREVITPSGVRLYVIPGSRALCLATADGTASCNLLPDVESRGIFIHDPTGTYRILPKTIPEITVRTSRGAHTIPVPDGIYVSPS